MQKGLEQIELERRERQDGFGRWCLEYAKGDMILEIGSGHGDFLAEYAQTHSQEVCVGLDLLNKRLEKCQRKAERRGLENLHFLKAKGEEFVEAVPDTVKFAKVYILYPDPWPKKRHFKNRLIQEVFLTNLAKKIKPGGRLYFRTDHQGYWEWTKEMIVGQEEWKILDDSEWDFEVETFFERVTGGAYGVVVAERV